MACAFAQNTPIQGSALDWSQPSAISESTLYADTELKMSKTLYAPTLADGSLNYAHLKAGTDTVCIAERRAVVCGLDYRRRPRRFCQAEGEERLPHAEWLAVRGTRVDTMHITYTMNT